MKKIYNQIFLIIVFVVILIGVSTVYVAKATHSWGGYHWARIISPFTLKFGDNVSTVWDTYLATALGDWSASSMLDTMVVVGGSKRNCGPIKGRVEVCNAKYGNNGWLGLAQIWVSGSHITQGVAKMNDTYFNTPTYNTSAWRRLVMCQEIAHTFGLDHQDEDFRNLNLGTCMDYTTDPDGTMANPDQFSNEYPNVHDFDQLGIIYSHLDSTVTSFTKTITGANQDKAEPDVSETKGWGRELRRDSRGRVSLYERDLGKGEKVITHVLWVNNTEGK